ncbi:MAG: hypothetical protein HGB22_08515 [Chlorobiaceae bacterium]|nr:hypothetical protein [Chlorobiaceae bacterium]
MILSVVAASAGAWLAFPWYAQALLEKAIGQNVSLKLLDAARPGLGNMKFGRLDAVLTTKPDTCTGIASTYRISIFNGTISWYGLQHPGSMLAGIEINADSLSVLQEPADILFTDHKPFLNGRIEIGRKSGIIPEIQLESLDYAFNDAVVNTGTIQLKGVSYKVHLAKDENWIQQPSRFRANTLFSAGKKTPLVGFEAIFGMARDPLKPCALIFTDCSAALSGIKASTPLIEYSLKNRQTRFTLNIDTLPLDRLAELNGKEQSDPTFTGNVSGSIPIEYLNSTIRINNGFINSETGALVTFRKKEGTPLISFDVGEGKGAPAMISNLNAVIAISSAGKPASSITIKDFSSKIFGGSITASQVSGPPAGKSAITLRLTDIPILERIRLYDGIKAEMKGSISGTIPISIDKKGFTISNARLSSKGGGTIRQLRPAEKPGTKASFGSTIQEVSWNFNEPSILLDRDSDGKTRIGFTLHSLSRKAGEGELMLMNPKGTVGLFEHPVNNSIISLSGFSAGLLTGSLAIEHADYDLKSKHAETVLILNAIPLQKLLDLQGTEKIHATGNIQGRMPVVLHGESIQIADGGMNAETSGQIIYFSTPEERAAANPGMRTTYEALGNFFYSELISTIAMSPDGKSHIVVQLRGRNPDFQNGRSINLNLDIEQNLRDLMRSLSISSGIEQAILEKASRSMNKK